MLAVVVAALILGQHSTNASYATRLQDSAVWRAVQLLLESFAFLLIGLQLPKVVEELAGISAAVLTVASLAVLATVIAVRIVWVYLFAYMPRTLSSTLRDREPRRVRRRCSWSRGPGCAAWCRWPRRSRCRRPR